MLVPRLVVMAMAQLKRDHPELALTATDEAGLDFWVEIYYSDTVAIRSMGKSVRRFSQRIGAWKLLHACFGAHTYTQNLPLSNLRVHSWFQKRKDDIGVDFLTNWSCGKTSNNVSYKLVFILQKQHFHMKCSYSPQRIKTSKKACFLENCKVVK